MAKPSSRRKKATSAAEINSKPLSNSANEAISVEENPALATINVTAVEDQLEATFSEWYKLAKASGLVIASQKTEEGLMVYEPNGQAVSFETMLERGWTLNYLQLQNQR